MNTDAPIAILLTSDPEVDASNVRRCLDAGYETVLAVVPAGGQLGINRQITKSLGSRSGCVAFCSYDVAQVWLKDSGEGNRGYTTKTRYWRGYKVISRFPEKGKSARRAMKRKRELLQRYPDTCER